MNKYYLGIDTSAYTTSISVIDDYMNIVFDIRKYLEVPKNKRGLRQQEAVFQHLNNFPKLLDEASKNFDISKIDTISVSTKPRNVTGSYMPVFIFGKNQAYILSKALNSKYKEFTHQEGHIGAGLISNIHMDKYGEFISLHMSGGTSEFLLVNNLESNLDINLIGCSLDISFGQLIDRVGVYLGYNFPSGCELDEIAKRGKVLDIKVPISVKERFWTNISGLENYFVGLIKKDLYREEDVVITLFYVISMIIKKIITNIFDEYGVKNILFTGGVAANTHIRRFLIEDLTRYNMKIAFPSKELCTDNSVGIAYLGKMKDGH